MVPGEGIEPSAPLCRRGVLPLDEPGVGGRGGSRTRKSSFLRRARLPVAPLGRNGAAGGTRTPMSGRTQRSERCAYAFRHGGNLERIARVELEPSGWKPGVLPVTPYPLRGSGTRESNPVYSAPNGACLREHSSQNTGGAGGTRTRSPRRDGPVPRPSASAPNGSGGRIRTYDTSVNSRSLDL